jgi:SAM-dependent methyltransferase
VLELGAGQGRDTVFLARHGFTVTALDYAAGTAKAISAAAGAAGLATLVSAARHDVRQPLPFPAGSFDASYSHMLFCMALTTPELERLAAEVRRVIRPGGLVVYTVRHAGPLLDPQNLCWPCGLDGGGQGDGRAYDRAANSAAARDLGARRELPAWHAGSPHPPEPISSRPLEKPDCRAAIAVSKPVAGSMRYRPGFWTKSVA